MYEVVILYDIENSPMEMLCYALEKAEEQSADIIRVYSDWTLCAAKEKWQDFFRSPKASFLQVKRTYLGKNSLDHALFQAALDMQKRKATSFIVVSSDTDFLRLAKTLHKRSKVSVIGIGGNENDRILKKVYDEFYHYTKDRRKDTMGKRVTEADQLVGEQLRQLFLAVANGEKWVDLGLFGQNLNKIKFPDIYPKQLKKIIKLHVGEFFLDEDGRKFCLCDVKAQEAVPKAPKAPQDPDTQAARQPLPEKMPERTEKRAEIGYAEAELRVRWKMALRMLHAGMDVDAVQKITDFSAEEIEDLREFLEILRA